MGAILAACLVDQKAETKADHWVEKKVGTMAGLRGGSWVVMMVDLWAEMWVEKKADHLAVKMVELKVDMLVVLSVEKKAEMMAGKKAGQMVVKMAVQ